MNQLFELGKLVATPGAIDLMFEDEVAPGVLLTRHLSGDWGDLDDHDKQVNKAALQYGNRILSAYKLKTGKVWVITEADRSSTTILLPEEY